MIRRGLWILLFAIVLTLGVSVRLQHREVRLRTPDETVYTLYARSIATGGPGAVQALVKAYHADPSRWVYPPPIRVGYLFLLALAMKGFISMEVAVGATVSLLFSLFNLLLIVALGIRFFSPLVAWMAAVFFSFFTPDLVVARRCWQDGMLAFFCALLLYFAGEALQKKRRGLWLALFAAAGFWVIITKESGVLFFLVCVACLKSHYFFSEKNLKEAVLAGLLGLSVLGCAFAFLVYEAGGLKSLLEIGLHIREAMASNRYALENQEGSWIFFAEGFFLLNPVTFVLALGGVFLAWCPERWLGPRLGSDARTLLRGFTVLLLFFLFVATFLPYFKNLRYLSVLTVPLCLLAAAGFGAVLDFLRRRTKRAFIYFAVALFALLGVFLARDYGLYKYYFVDLDSQDLSQGHLADIRTHRESKNW